MDSTLVVAIAVAVLALVISCVRNFNNYLHEPKLKPGQAPLPPGNLGWPLFGNMSEFFRAFKSDNPEAFISSYFTRHGRRGIYKAFMFRQPTVLAVTPEACKLVLCKTDLFEIGWPEPVLHLIGPRTLAGLRGREHMRLSKTITPTINSPRAIQHQLPRIEKNVRQMIESWLQQGQVTMLDEVKKFNLKTIHDILLGEDSGLNLNGMAETFYAINRGLRALPINFPWTDYGKARKAYSKIQKSVEKVFHERKGGKDVKSDDTLSLLLEATHDDGTHLDDEQMITQIVSFLNGGQESTAHLIMWLAILLKKHPHVFEKVKAEQDAIALEKSPGDSLMLSDIKSMKYLFRVIDETLRLVNIAPFGFRQALVDVEFDGYTIPKGWSVEPWLRQLHLDPEIHKNPKEFDPNRWIDEKPEQNTFMPFGAGNRKCPGSNLSKFQACMFVHYLVVNCEWEPLNPNCKLDYLPHPRPRDRYEIKVKRRT